MNSSLIFRISRFRNLFKTAVGRVQLPTQSRTFLTLFTPLHFPKSNFGTRYFNFPRYLSSEIFKNKKPPQQPSAQPSSSPQQPKQQPQSSFSPRKNEPTTSDTSSYIVQVNMMNFIPFVLQSPVPVIVECYADYFEEGKEMSGMLQSLVQEAEGAIRLARINIDHAPDLIEKLKINNVPTVIGFFGGRVVASFVGVQSREGVNEFVDALLKKGGSQNVEMILEEGDQLLEQQKVQEAAQLFSSLMQTKSLKAEPQALAGLARAALLDKKLDVAKQIFQQIHERFPSELSHPYVRKAAAAIELASQSPQDMKAQEALLKEIQTNPSNLQARYDLAISYFQISAYEKSLDQCFEIIKQDKSWQDQAARKLAIKIFDALGQKNPITKQGRKRLSNLLF
jgi:putative thioredoxin